MRAHGDAAWDWVPSLLHGPILLFHISHRLTLSTEGDIAENDQGLHFSLVVGFAA